MALKESPLFSQKSETSGAKNVIDSVEETRQSDEVEMKVFNPVKPNRNRESGLDLVEPNILNKCYF